MAEHLTLGDRFRQVCILLAFTLCIPGFALMWRYPSEDKPNG